MTKPLANINIVSERVLAPPAELHRQLPVSEQASATIAVARREIKAILDRQDHRLLVVIGPCSIHDISAAKEYARRLKTLQLECADTLMIVMRVYFEKPRSTIGWKGLINDPDLNDTFRIEKGLRQARELLIWLAELGLPTGTEALDPISPQYLADLFSWTAIGARTTESQTHREMSSGLSTPIGFKNATNGSLNVAINAMQSASMPHRFLGINSEGQVTITETRGNQYGHIILRGGQQANYAAADVADAELALQKAELAQNIIIDCSHANSNKDFTRQPLVAQDVAQQIVEGNRSIVGLMLESHLSEGQQKMTPNSKDLQYGVSITDACIGWETSETLLRNLRDTLKKVLPKR